LKPLATFFSINSIPGRPELAIECLYEKYQHPKICPINQQ